MKSDFKLLKSGDVTARSESVINKKILKKLDKTAQKEYGSKFTSLSSEKMKKVRGELNIGQFKRVELEREKLRVNRRFFYR